MNWFEKILDMIDVRAIVVTGPQRSGTTFMAYAIANDLGWKYIDEAVFDVDNHEKFNGLIFSQKNIVIQCPAMMRWIDNYSEYKKILFVVMIRDIQGIIKSEKKRNWKFESYEKSKYLDTGIPKIIETPVSITKYKYFKYHQESLFFRDRLLKIRYPEDVSGHPLYVPDVERDDWTIKQVVPGSPFAPVDDSIEL